MLRCRKRDLLDRVEEEINEEKQQLWNSYYLGNGSPLQMETFVENRRRLIKEMSSRCRLSFIFLEGEKLSSEDLEEMVEPFIQDKHFFWIFGVLEPNYCGAIDVLNEKTYLFYPEDSFVDCNWDRESSLGRFLKKKYMTDFAESLENMTNTLDDLNYNLAYTLQKRVSGRLIPSKAISKLEKFVKVDNDELLPVISKLRMVKSRNEIEVIRYLSKVASSGLRFLVDCTVPGLSEYKLMALLSDYVLRSGGCRVVSNKTSCFSSFSLRNFVHYSHSPSWDSVLKDGELCLVDVCCSYFGYITTVSITFPVSGKFTVEQEKLYRIVLKMREAILEKLMCKNVTVEELNTLATMVLLTHLKSDFDILSHPVEECLNAGIGEIFMPMKPCRLIGLGEEGLEEIESIQLPEGSVLAVAPGCYFAEQLIDKALLWKREFVRDTASKLRKLGAVRLTDLVLITDKGYQLLTDLPRSPQDLENCLAAAAQDRIQYSNFISLRPSSQTHPFK